MKTTTIVGLVVVIALGGFLAYQVFSTPDRVSSEELQGGMQGKIVVGITDAATSLENISSISLTLDRIELWSETTGWIKILENPKQYELLELKATGEVAFAGELNVPVGTYNQIRFGVREVTVSEAGKTTRAKLPSSEIKITGTTVVRNGATSIIVADFIADESLHRTGNGLFVFAPVVQLESRSNANVSVHENMIEVEGGNLDADIRVGMDINGEVKNGLTLTQGTALELLGGIIHVKTASEAEAVVEISAQGATETALTEDALDVVIAVRLVLENGKRVWEVSGTKGLIPAKIKIDAVTGVIISS